jgi:AraC family transcriptional regulator of adaptative response / DNA-3-methyladenine glycosylase II
VETTVLPMGDIAFAAGFSSIRQFNATMLEVYDIPPTVLRERAARSRGPAQATRRRPHPEPSDTGATGVLRLRLPYRPPIDIERMFGFLAARTIPGVEVASPGEYRRTIKLPNGCGLLSLRPVPSASWVECSLVLSDLRDVTAAVQRCRRLLDLDADPAAISGFFDGDPLLGPLAAKFPGRRSIGAVDGDEIAVRAVLGQQVSVAAARRLGGRLTALYGTPLPSGLGASGWGLTHVFPDAATIAALDPATLPMPLSRGRALVTLAASLAGGDIQLDAGADREEVGARLVALPGIGPWTAGYIRMRALSDPDVFLEGDVGVVRALRGLEADQVAPAPGVAVPGVAVPGVAVRKGAAPPVSASAVASRWHPWRSYAVHHLWAIDEPPASPVAVSRAAGSRAAGSRVAGSRAAGSRSAS